MIDGSTFGSLNGLSEAARARALARFQVLRPFLEDNVPLRQVAVTAGISLRTARYWIERYRTQGLAGLSRKARVDKDRPRVALVLQKAIEGMALQRPKLSAATIHRKAVAVAIKMREPVPSYSFVYQLIRRIDPALLTMAHEGAKAYSETFDLVHRREAEAPNAIWQADHTQLDILVKDEKGHSRRPWLTIILDDYSRAVAGYFVSLSAPSALQTSLALRQAIWRKSQAGWHVCGIPKVLYTDHGSDFTSRHIEQVAADLKIQIIFSGVGRPRGRGKIERFFESLAQVFFSRLPGYAREQSVRTAVLTLPQLTEALERYLIDEYLVTVHRTTGEPPQTRWETGGFLPHMPESAEQLDLLLLSIPKARRVRQDGIRFMGMRYIDPTLAAYVGEEILLRYDPRDVSEVRLFHRGRFLCRAVCQELAGETVPLREIVSARDRRRRELRQTLQDRRKAVDSLIEARRWAPTDSKAVSPEPESPPPPVKLKRYFNE